MGRFQLVQSLVRMLAPLLIVLGGIRVIALGSAPVGVLLLTVGGITLALAARAFFSRTRAPDGGDDSSGELAKEQFDYIVWFALGLPIVLVLGLLVFVLTGSR